MLNVTSCDQLQIGDILKVTDKDIPADWWLFEVYTVQPCNVQWLDSAFHFTNKLKRGQTLTVIEPWFFGNTIIVLNR